ncbi:hypothetical protein HAX54_003850 [Datura stramonium]|uniref:Uncharacterized protein n=1 Tax=Datura stramonium TaxID=4076 RepID=A0ABS8T776_DATST|nr:hypothetical protein [Datura stramonium]
MILAEIIEKKKLCKEAHAKGRFPYSLRFQLATKRDKQVAPGGQGIGGPASETQVPSSSPIILVSDQGDEDINDTLLRSRVLIVLVATSGEADRLFVESYIVQQLDSMHQTPFVTLTS